MGIVAVQSAHRGASCLMAFARNCQGAIAVEFAVMLLPMLLLMCGIFDTGFAFLDETKITFAVEAAAKLRCRQYDALRLTNRNRRLRRVGGSSAGPRRLRICRHDSSLWDQRDGKLPLRWYGPAGRHTDRGGLLSNRVTSR